ncbi:MAG: hypothetical protein ACUVQY_08245 [Thermoproteota archaeon]
MSRVSTIRLEIPDKNIRMEFTGNENDAVKDLLIFLIKIYPRLNIIEQIVYTPDLEALLSSISQDVKISGGEVILLREEGKTTESKILLLLAGCYTASRFGLREKSSLSVEEMTRSVANTSKKTIQNTLVELIKKGFVTRQARGTFEISTKGIMMLSGGNAGETQPVDKPSPSN